MREVLRKFCIELATTFLGGYEQTFKEKTHNLCDNLCCYKDTNKAPVYFQDRKRASSPRSCLEKKKDRFTSGGRSSEVHTRNKRKLSHKVMNEDYLKDGKVCLAKRI